MADHNNSDSCDWHKGDEPIDWEDAYCPECSRELTTRTCQGCGKTFLNYEAEGFDDVSAAPRGTSSGDLCCAACLPGFERALERQEREDSLDDFDFADPFSP